MKIFFLQEESYATEQSLFGKEHPLLPKEKRLFTKLSFRACRQITNIPGTAILRRFNPGHDTKGLLITLNLWMVPVSLGLIFFTWVIPAVIQFFKNAPREHSFKPANIRKTLEFYGLLALIALTVTAASAVLLAIVKIFAPTAPDVIIRMEKGDAVSAAGIFLTLLLAPVIEETAFRGLIQHHVKRALPERLYIIAVLVASVYFGLWHRNLGQFVYTTTWALLFGLIYNATGKVRHTIFMHALGNLLAVLSFSTTNNAVLGKRVVLPAMRAWLMDLPLFPAILILILLVLVIIVVMSFALYLASGRKGRLLRLIGKKSA